MERAQRRSDVVNSLLEALDWFMHHRTGTKAEIRDGHLCSFECRGGERGGHVERRSGGHETAITLTYRISRFHLEDLCRGRGVSLSRTSKKDIAEGNLSEMTLWVWLGKVNLLGDLDEPRVEEVVPGVQHFDSTHFVLQVIPPRAMEVDVVELEPTLPEPFGEPRHPSTRRPNGLRGASACAY